MVNAYDIFRARADGSVLWRESAPTLTAANARIRQLAAVAPGDYIVVNQQTGTKLVVVDPWKTTNHVAIRPRNLSKQRRSIQLPPSPLLHKSF